MKLSIAVVPWIAGAVACSQAPRPQSATSPPPPTSVQLPYDEPMTPASGVGSGRTVSMGLVPTETARDQAASAQDEESIREIRSLLVGDRSLATLATGIRIVARDGRVWLRGQVNTREQRATVEKMARGAVGVRDVRNELVVLE